VRLGNAAQAGGADAGVEGLGRDEILLRFRDKYGEKILSAPTVEGFNLTAWLVPFVMLAAGAAVVATTLVRWRATRETSPSEAVPRPLSELDRRRLQAELAKEKS